MIQHVAASLLVLASAAAVASAQQNVRVSAHIVVVDRDAVSRAGASYVTLGDGRVRMSSRRGVRLAPLEARAFLELARQRRWTRTESTQSVVALSGSEARISSMQGDISGRGSTSRGPWLSVIPTVLPDGRIHLEVSTGVQDRRERVWGTQDVSPARVESQIIGRAGEGVVVASSTVVESSSRSGPLHLAREDRAVDVFVVITPEVLD